MTGPRALLERAAASRLSRRVAGAATTVGSAPGRAVCIGEHTDYTGGRALAFAIDRYVAVALAPAPAGYTLVGADDLPVVRARAAVARSRPAERWANLPLGVLAELDRIGRPVPPCTLQVAADLPRNAGLSSSAALAAATLVAALRWTGAALEAGAAARLCWRAEHDFAGIPCGQMDQLTVVGGRPGAALLLDFAGPAPDPNPVPLRTPGAVWFGVDSGVRHDTGGTGYRTRRREWERVRRRLARLGVDARRLRPRDVASLTRTWPPPLPDRLRHVVGENRRVDRAVAAAAGGDTHALGRLLDRTQSSLRDRYSVGDPTTDRLAAALRRTPGVLGARVIGAGFGGTVLVLAGEPARGRDGALLRAAAAAVLGHPAPVLRLRVVGGAAGSARDVLHRSPRGWGRHTLVPVSQAGCQTGGR